MYDNNLQTMDATLHFPDAQENPPALDEAGIIKAPVSLKFWEIESFFKCPVVGLCLTLREQKQLLKKEDVSLKSLSVFEMHERLVASGDGENTLSRKVDALLTHKFSKETAPLRLLSEQAFMRHLRASFEAAQYVSVFWAAATRADLSTTARREIFGIIHMSMHANAEKSIQTRQQINQLFKRIEDQALAISALKEARKEIRRENDMLRIEQTQMKAKLLAAQNEKTDLLAALAALEALDRQEKITELEAENRRLQGELTESGHRLYAAERNLHHYENSIAAAVKDMERSQFAAMRPADESKGSLSSARDKDGCDPSCPAYDRCPKRILIVGGIERMEARYRQAVESAGGVMEYHPGHTQGGTTQLENSLRRADVVLCPVNCNSHSACLLVKNFGKKHNKPVYMMPSFSLSAVSRIIKGGRTEKTVQSGRHSGL